MWIRKNTRLKELEKRAKFVTSLQELDAQQLRLADKIKSCVILP